VGKQVVKIPGIKAPSVPFSHVVRAGNLLFLTSQLSSDLKEDRLIIGNITEQTRQALENIRFLLESSGATLDDIVKVAVYMKDVSEFDEMDKVYREYFKKGEEPARVTVQALSPLEGIRIEIDVIAVLPDSG